MWARTPRRSTCESRCWNSQSNLHCAHRSALPGLVPHVNLEAIRSPRPVLIRVVAHLAGELNRLVLGVVHVKVIVLEKILGEAKQLARLLLDVYQGCLLVHLQARAESEVRDCHHDFNRAIIDDAPGDARSTAACGR